MNNDEIQSRFLAQEEYLGTAKPVNTIEPVVSVCVTTYQHAPFIRQCLDGVLMQQTSFPFEIVVGEDESTDGTREICMEYAQRYPDKIRLFLRSRALSHHVVGGRAIRFNGVWNRRSARGKYIALCEGDDYWTASNKLQAQVDLLEAHPECSMCFHNVLKVIEGSNEAPRPAYRYNMRPFYDFADLLPNNFVHTPSVMFRRSVLPNPPPAWFYGMPMYDWPNFLFMAQKGRLAYLMDTMAVYRLHPGGVWSRMSREQWLDKSILAGETLLKELPCADRAAAAAFLKLRKNVLSMHVERGDVIAASGHARKLLYQATVQFFRDVRWSLRCYLKDIASFSNLILRARVPRLSARLRRAKPDRLRPGVDEKN